MNRETFLSLVEKDNPTFKLDKISQAYDFCCEAHNGQFRKSGEPYAIHPISVALEVSRLNIDEASVISALLHDVIEDTKFTHNDIANNFGKEIAGIVEGVTKLDKIRFQQKDIRQVENFRKLFLAISKDVRVLIIKLCDRVHNMRTLQFQKPEKQKSIALETIEIYAPLAERVGLQRIKNELQDLSFKILYPDEYNKIARQVDELKADFASKHIVEDIETELKETLDVCGIDAYVFGREKMPYSIWKKMHVKHIQFAEISDIFAFRIIVKNEEDCYRALGVIHTNYNAIPGKFKDFISIPKSNGYRSLHTKIMGPRGRIVDIQIRTQAMHNEDEFGLASHWKYKQGMTNDEKVKYLRASWIQRVLEVLQDSKTTELLHNAKTEIQEVQVMAFTESGEVLYLPANSKILDFAFAVNNELGLYFDYAIVNGQQVGIDYTIHNGDKVIIHTAEKSLVNSVWLNYTITGKARNAIIEALGGTNN